jgi:dienelactone hydrolase
MAEVLVFHHALGLTPGVLDLAETLRGGGHTVHTPDLYEGRTFGKLDDGVAYARSVGFGELMERGIRAADDLPAELVYVGFSMGVMPAQNLAQTRPGAKAAILCYSCLPVSEFGERWPERVPVQVHAMDADPWFVDEGDLEAARELVGSTAKAELFLYPGAGHLFADSSTADYDESAATLLVERVLAFLQKA